MVNPMASIASNPIFLCPWVLSRQPSAALPKAGGKPPRLTFGLQAEVLCTWQTFVCRIAM